MLTLREPMRYPFVCVLVASSFLFPGILADGAIDQSTTAPSRHYLDPLTQLVYYYDAEMGTLTLDPFGGTTAGTTVFAHVDVYGRGQHPDTYSSATGACTFDFCVSWLLAYVGNHPASLRVRDWPGNSACPGMDNTEYRSATLGLVTYWRGTWGFNHCSPALACAHLFTDNVARWSDCITY